MQKTNKRKPALLDDNNNIKLPFSFDVEMEENRVWNSSKHRQNLVYDNGKVSNSEEN